MPIDTDEQIRIKQLIQDAFIRNSFNFGDIINSEPAGKYIITEEQLYKIIEEIMYGL